jgi:hypothetical protein
MKQSTFYYLLRRGVIGGGGLNPLAGAYRDRVEADGGIIESIKCVANALKAFPQADTGRLLFEPYSTRVLTDGGSIEARNCAIDSINTLN